MVGPACIKIFCTCNYRNVSTWKPQWLYDAKNLSFVAAEAPINMSKSAFRCFLSSIGMVPKFIAFEPLPSTLNVSNLLLSIWHWSASSNASNSASAHFLVDQDSPCCPNQNRHLWIIEISAHTFKSMKYNHHKFCLANEHFKLPISSNGNKDLTRSAHCVSLAEKWHLQSTKHICFLHFD